jgi:hypothetical protein
MTLGFLPLSTIWLEELSCPPIEPIEPVPYPDNKMTLQELRDVAEKYKVTVPLKNRRYKNTYFEAFVRHNATLGHPPPIPRVETPQKNQNIEPPKKRKRPPLESITDMSPSENQCAWWYTSPKKTLACKEHGTYFNDHLICDE